MDRQRHNITQPDRHVPGRPVHPLPEGVPYGQDEHRLVAAGLQDLQHKETEVQNV